MILIIIIIIMIIKIMITIIIIIMIIIITIIIMIIIIIMMKNNNNYNNWHAEVYSLHGIVCLFLGFFDIIFSCIFLITSKPLYYKHPRDVHTY